MATSFNIGGGAGRARRAVPGLLFAPLALLAALTTGQTTQPVFEGPRLSIPVKQHEFGVVERGEVLEATFELHNVGNEPLKVLRVKPGCGCTVASYDEVIPPGQVGKVHAKVDTRTLAGQIGKGISITTNDSAVQVVLVEVRATVVGSVVILPGYKALLSNRQTETRSTPFLIRQEPGERGVLDIPKPRASVPWIDVEVQKLTEKQPSEKGLPAGWPGDWRLVATLKKEAPAGHHQETIHFETGLTREPEVLLNIAVDMRPPVNLNTSEVRLVAGQPLMVLASLRSDLNRQPIKLSAPQGLSARAEQGQGRFLKIHLQWDGPPPEAPVELQMEVAGETQTTMIEVVASD